MNYQVRNSDGTVLPRIYATLALAEAAIERGVGDSEAQAIPTEVPERFTARDAGCLFDGAHGQDANDRAIVGLAKRYGWPISPRGLEGETWDDDVAEATDYLNEHVAPEGYSFGWHEGDFFLQSEAWWTE